jgi:hypothetical protein
MTSSYNISFDTDSCPSFSSREEIEEKKLNIKDLLSTGLVIDGVYQRNVKCDILLEIPASKIVEALKDWDEREFLVMKNLCLDFFFFIKDCYEYSNYEEEITKSFDEFLKEKTKSDFEMFILRANYRANLKPYSKFFVINNANCTYVKYKKPVENDDDEEYIHIPSKNLNYINRVIRTFFKNNLQLEKDTNFLSISPLENIKPILKVIDFPSAQIPFKF